MPAAWRDAVLQDLLAEIGDPATQVFRLRWRHCPGGRRIEIRALVGETRGTAEPFEIQMPPPPGWDDAAAQRIHPADPEDARGDRALLAGRAWA